MSQIEIWRGQAANALKSLVPKIAGGINPTDGLVDDLLRVLSGLPDRPVDRQPYVGIFTAADVPSWRRQAADRLATLVPKIPNVVGSINDEQVDSLIRALGNLPPRPDGREPYEGIFAAADLPTWRKQAGNRLFVQITGLKGNISANDGLVDDLVRSISQLPARPSGRKPYEGLFPGLTIGTARNQAAERVKQLVTNLEDDFNPKDVLVDNLIRAVNKLPARPPKQEPYEGLFSSPSSPTSNLISLAQLEAIAPFSSQSRLTQLVPFINQALNAYKINTPLRIVHFIAQIAHESDAFNTNEEYASGADYEGRGDLGNTQPGDGRRFKGRGLIQVTGRANYRDCGKALGVDLINNPKRLADFDLAARSAGWFWNREGLNEFADRDDVTQITRIINGGYNGLDDRKAYLSRAKRVFRI